MNEGDELKVEVVDHAEWRLMPSDCFAALGVGHTQGVSYVILSYPRAQALRLALGLAPTDLHVTLGLGPRGDVHNVPKGLTTLVRSSLREFSNAEGGQSSMAMRETGVGDLTPQ